MRTIFLGGTCGDKKSPTYNRWREDIVIPGLREQGIPLSAIFNPVVEEWTRADQLTEDATKHDPATIMLYVITTTGMPESQVSAYSLVELTMALYDDPERTVVVFDVEAFSGPVAKAMRKAVTDLWGRFPDEPIFSSIEQAIVALVEKWKEDYE